MLRSIAACVFCLLSVSAYAHQDTDLKLSCAVTAHATAPGESERRSGTMLVEVHDTSGAKFISGTGIGWDMVGVNYTSPGVLSMRDFSNDGKWELENTLDTKNGSPPLKTDLSIDRNTGDLIYTASQEIYRNGRSIGYFNMLITGKCEKVDTAKQKF